MEGLDKILSHSKTHLNTKNNENRKNDSKNIDTTSKSSQYCRRSSITNLNFTRNYLNYDSKKFIQNIISNTAVGRKETFPKLVLFHLESDPEYRTNEQIQATAKILGDQKLFSQFGNNKQVLLSIAQYATLHMYEQNQQIFSQNSRCQNIHKLFDGAVELLKDEIDGKQNSEYGKQNCRIITEKGQFLQSYQGFNAIKKNSAKAISKSYILSVPYHIYTKNLSFYQQNKIIKKLLHKTSIFNAFSQKQIDSLLQICPEQRLFNKQILFKQGNSIVNYLQNKREGQMDKNNTNNLMNTEHKLMYFIVQGEIQISKKCRNKPYSICTLGEGNFVGDQAIFSDSLDKRPYTAQVCTLHAKVIPISNKNIQQWIKIKSLGINYQFFIGKIKKSVKAKLDHYENSVYQSQIIKSSVFTNAASNSLTNAKKEKLKNISNIVGHISGQVEGMEKIKMKRLNFKSVSEEVNFEEPLFTRKDFPAIGSYLKRFENEQKRALDQYKRNRSLHIE